VESGGTSGDRGLQEALRTAVERTLQRGQEARETSASLTGRVVEAIREMRLASGEEVRALDEQLAEIERRVSELERRTAKPEPEVEGQ
jgi:hypothetical protein